jgi:hypothetical protein
LTPFGVEVVWPVLVLGVSLWLVVLADSVVAPPIVFLDRVTESYFSAEVN